MLSTVLAKLLGVCFGAGWVTVLLTHCAAACAHCLDPTSACECACQYSPSQI